MPSNYAKIEADNIRRRGTEFNDIGNLLAEKLYSDPSHFVFELLQNAEDALARRTAAERRRSVSNNVEFSLRLDRLEVRHFGSIFTLGDVRGICDVLNGTKADEPDQIGRFGIGFKSVYSITSSPEIHSGDEHFRIDGYIKPRSVKNRSTLPSETLFVFPFNHSTLSCETTFELIRDRLTRLGAGSLLFLRHIDEIKWEIEGYGNGSFSRQSTAFRLGRRVELRGRSTGGSEDEEWIVYEKATKHSALPLEVASKVIPAASGAQGESIAAVPRSELFVSFPTDKQMNFGFLLNGPFLTTPARDNIILNSTNRSLIEEASFLVGETLTHLKSIGLLSVDALQTYPLRRDQFPADDPFHPIFKRVFNELRSGSFIPIEGGKFATSESVKISGSAEMRALFSKNQLGELLGDVRITNWVSGSITKDRAPELREYFERELGIEELRPEMIVARLTESFLQKQTDAWIIQLYEFLLTQRSLWAGYSSGSGRGAQLRTKPILRLEDGSHVRPPLHAEDLQVYLSSGRKSTFPTIRRRISSHPEARRFLDELGIKEPDIVDDVATNVLPKYDQLGSSFLAPETVDESYEHDLALIKRAIDSSVTSKKLALIRTLQVTPFIRAICAADEIAVFGKPSSVYLRNPDLEIYFAGNKETYFVDESVRHLKRISEELKVSSAVRLVFRPDDSSGYVHVEGEHRENTRGVNRFDPDARIDGLSHALSTIDEIKSRFIWNKLLVPHSFLIRGEIQTSGRKSFSVFKSTQVVSPLGKLVMESKWLPDGQGAFHSPRNLALEDLPSTYIKDDTLGVALGMDSSIRVVGQNYGVHADLLRFFVENADAQKIIQQLQEQAAKMNSNLDGNRSDVDVPGAIDDIFSRPDKSPATQVYPRERPVPNAVLRRERALEEIEDKKIAASSNGAPRKVSMQRSWVPKDDAIRAFLLDEYRGHCQICDNVFHKRDGSPYFEGFYLISRMDNAWVEVPGNVLSLCPTCCAKMMYGSIYSKTPVGEQIKGLVLWSDGGRKPLKASFFLCDESVSLRFTDRHLIELQALLAASNAIEL